MNKKNNIDWISDLRIAAAVFVIVIHVSMESRYNNALYADLIYGAFGRFSVPVFVMISGALLLPRESPLLSFTKNWTSKILIPYAFWLIFYILYNLHLRKSQGEIFTPFQLIKEGFSYLTQGTGNFHFWYIYMIAGVYLFIPIIGKAVRNCTEKQLLYYLLIWFCALLLQVPFFSFLHTALDFHYFYGYLGFLILGYYLSLKDDYSFIQALFFILLGYGITAGLTYYMTKTHNAFDHTFYDYLRPNIIVLSIGIFLFFKKLNGRLFKNPILKSFRDSLAKHSYGIYLIHWLVIIGLQKVGITWTFITPMIGIPFTTICCLLISFLLVWLVNKLPYGNYISG